MNRRCTLAYCRRLLAFVGSLLLATGVVNASGLTNLAPPDTVALVAFEPQPQVAAKAAALVDDIAALDWARAFATLEALAEAFGQGNASIRSNLIDPFDSPQAAPEGLDCLALDAALADVEVPSLAGQYLATLSANRFNPVPALSLLLRLRQESLGEAQEVFGALVECYGGPAPLVQDGIELHILFDGKDLPFVIGLLDDLLVASTNPDVARAVIRRARGSGERSLADTDLHARTEATLARGVVTYGVNAAALADVAASFGTLIAHSPELRHLLDRGVALLRTVGGLAGTVAITPAGVLVESITAVDPEGGDPALAELLLCPRCSAARPFVAPEGSVAIQTRHVPFRSLFGYVQGWLDDIGAAQGVRFDLRELAAEHLSLDLDAALLDWIGNQVHAVTLESLGPQLSTLLYRPGQVFIMPVADPELAAAALPEWGSSMLLLGQALSGATASLGELLIPDAGMSGRVTASTLATYRDVDVHRYRIGLNVDIGAAVLGSYLLVATPARAVEPLIDTFYGHEAALQRPDYLAAWREAPSGSAMIGFRDDAATLTSLSELVALVSQPLAFLIYTGYEAALSAGHEPPSDPAGRPDLRQLSFDDVLHLTDMIPEALHVVAQRARTTGSYSVVDGDTIYRRSLIRVSW